MKFKLTHEVGGEIPDRLIEAAEALFAEKGSDAVSLRELTAAAGVSLGSVNYYFRSKNALTEAVYDNLCLRINAIRLGALDESLAAAKRQRTPPRLNSILTSFVLPYVDSRYERSGLLLARLILEHRLRPSALTRGLYDRHLDPLARRFIDAIALACPDLPFCELLWRYTFMVNTVVLTATDREKYARIQKLSDGRAGKSDSKQLERSLLAFLGQAFSVAAP